MKHSNLDPLGVNIAFWRALLPAEGFTVTDPAPGSGRAGAWWGGPQGVPLTVRPGDRLILFATPWGVAYEGTVKGLIQEPASET